MIIVRIIVSVIYFLLALYAAYQSNKVKDKFVKFGMAALGTLFVITIILIGT